NSSCGANSSLTYCLEDADYPDYEIKGALVLTICLPRSMLMC
ncbi:hypothetical protein Pmani_024581, partial [Petrolisthes manimaculis]